MTALDDLREIRGDRSLSSSQVFEAIFAAGSILNDDDREAEVSLEIAIRLLEARRNGQLPADCVEAVEFLAEECGLYPYISIDQFSYLSQSVIEAHAIKLEEKLYLHSKQMQVLLWLLDGDNVVLSAPTSYRNFFDRYTLVTTISERYDPDRPTIFVLTQERFIQRHDDLAIDFLFVDEFYKLDPDRGDTRFETLNLALYRALPKSRQCFMAGPHIRDIHLGDKWRGNFRFVRTDYRTVTVNVIDRSNRPQRFEVFLSDLRSVGDGSSLVFTATPGTAQSLMDDLVESGVTYASEFGPKVAVWVSSNYHPEWPVAKGNERGIAIHHGRLPRSLGQLFVHLFNDGSIKVLICTSTLIEGVNTSAANVFIYDKKIARADFDFFSFANIRGRVGRMMRHFVGNAFLYHEPPGEIETEVRVPILVDPGASTDFLVMNVERNELSSNGRQRQDDLPRTTGLTPGFLKEHGGLGVELLLILRDRIAQILAVAPETLLWIGFPNKEQRKTLAELALIVAHSRRDPVGLHTNALVGWAWHQLGRVRTLPKFLSWFASLNIFEDKRAEGVDAAFQFLQACEFSFPRTLAAVDALVRLARPGANVDYGPYIVNLEKWFRPQWMKDLDEAGIPLPLAERLAPYLDDPSDRAEAIIQITALNWRSMEQLDEIDRFILALAIEAR